MIMKWNEMTLNFYLSKEISKDKMEVMLDRYEDDLNTFYSKIYNDFSQNRKNKIFGYNNKQLKKWKKQLRRIKR